jgi:hypothetical protein
MINKKIGWQKYEEVLKSQISSSLLKEIIEEAKNLYSDKEDDIDSDLLEIEEDEAEYEDNYTDTNMSLSVPVISIPPTLMAEAAFANNFDCWIGHTNFNITEDIKNKLNTIDGVEVLKIMSRYRFFVGIGRMFDFKEVREQIENTIRK